MATNYSPRNGPRGSTSEAGVGEGRMTVWVWVWGPLNERAWAILQTSLCSHQPKELTSLISSTLLFKNLQCNISKAWPGHTGGHIFVLRLLGHVTSFRGIWVTVGTGLVYKHLLVFYCTWEREEHQTSHDHPWEGKGYWSINPMKPLVHEIQTQRSQRESTGWNQSSTGLCETLQAHLKTPHRLRSQHV